jgi:hypothetical protein
MIKMGRQILNLMNVDVGVIASLATRVLGLSEAAVKREYYQYLSAFRRPELTSCACQSRSLEDSCTHCSVGPHSSRWPPFLSWLL